MPIKAIPGPDGSIRDLQAQLAEVGRIRLGTFNGKYPEKLDRFRFTSADQALIDRVAGLYGGTPSPWTPLNGKGQQWELISDAKRIPVYIPPQHIDPWNEAWAGGRTCVRRCDGETEIIKDEPCACRSGAIKNPRDLCKPTVRVQLMLVEVPGIGSWRLESHGRYAVERLVILAPLVRRVPLPVPAFLVLKEETRRPWNDEKKKFDTLTFYVPELHISAVSAEQIAIGGDALTQALTAAGAPTALTAGPVREIEAAPSGELSEDEKTRILTAIEKANTLDALRAIKDGLDRRNILDIEVLTALDSKRAAVTAAAEVGGSASGPHAVGDQVEVAGMTFTKIAESPFPDRREHQAGLKRAVDTATQTPQKAAQPCNDPFCGGETSGCGWTVKEHQDHHGKDLIKNMPLGLPAERPTVVPGNADRVYVPEVVQLPDEDPQVPAPAKPSTVGGIATARASLMAAAGPLGWTTQQTLARLAEHAGIESGMKATIGQLNAFREAIEEEKVK
jgi:hypothetical protein